MEEVVVAKQNMSQHKITMNSRMTDFYCDVCEIDCVSKRDMESHDKRFHGEDGQFNCIHCSFQGNSKERVSNHMREAHLLKCHNCEQTFQKKQDLMQHRKAEHLEKIKICKYFEEGNCNFNNSCWYKHTTDVISKDTNVYSEQEFKCNSCGTAFKGRGDLIIHRKQVHYNTISQCKNFQRGNL